MLKELHCYDVYPKVLPTGKEETITIQPLTRPFFEEGKKYEVLVCALEDGDPRFPDWCNFRRLPTVRTENGSLRFTCDFPTEQEYALRIFEDDAEKPMVQLSVYAVADDLVGRYPFQGDLHIHSCRSDGGELPEVVAANYRRAGYDFMAITDHRRYYPSLEAIRKLAPLNLDFSLVPGEEVHMPYTSVHIVNFGGTFSINGLVDTSMQHIEKGDDPTWRSMDGKCPPVRTEAEYEKEIRAMMKDAPFQESEAACMSYAVCQWIFDRIHDADGLGIFAHPYWRANMYHVPERFLDEMMKNHPFDAFEVLGGENYFEQNGFQTIRYYEDRARGYNYPIVGSTDSHNSTENNRNGFICSTIVFAPDNSREQLIDSVKRFYSVAVDSISTEFRLVGDLRLVKYACFLKNYYFPLHDRVCEVEGELLRAYVAGDPDAASRIAACRDATSQMRRKYFAFGRK